MVRGEEESVDADKAYDSQKIRTTLKNHGIRDRILMKKPKGKELRWSQKLLNKLYSKIRCGVEKVFAHWKGFYGYTRARYRGWDQNQAHLHLMAMVYNLKRGSIIMKKKRLSQSHCA